MPLGFHSLDARESALLPWLYSTVADRDPKVFQRLMQREAASIRQLLQTRGVRYEALKSALRPTDRGRQVVFLYDWWEDPSANYAVAFGAAYLPQLRSGLRSSLLHGDLLSLGTHQVPTDDLQRKFVPRRHGSATDLSLLSNPNWSTLYAVYFNNLTSNDIAALHNSLSEVPRYRGYVDVSFSGPIRDYVASTLAHEMVICDRRVILSHGSDDPVISDEDPMMFGLKKYGYDVVSLIGEYFHAFMSYKVEITGTPGAELDRLLNLAALTGRIIDVENVPIVVPPDKLSKYLLVKEDKLRLMTSVGLQDVTPDELASIIRNKLAQSYVYDLRYAQDGTPTFAVTAEFAKHDGNLTRRLLALRS